MVNEETPSSQKTHLNIGTWNVRGINSNLSKQRLEEDLNKYKLDVICIQESKIKEGIEININRSRLICFETECRHYGLGFLINESWKNNIHRVWSVSDRVAVMQLKSKHGKIISLINVYGPTLKISEDYPNIRDKFYEQLNKTYKQSLKSSCTTLILGDFNSKVGRRTKDSINTDEVVEYGEKCLGSHSRGRRNENGEVLIDFCEFNKLFVANSAFNHSARHQTTWVGQRTINGRVSTIYNQIDFIICRRKDRGIFLDARSYAGTSLTSDHKLVIGRAEINWHKIYKSNKTAYIPKINIRKFTTEPNMKKKYENELRTHLNTRVENSMNDPQENWEELKNIIKSAATSSVGLEPKPAKRNTPPDSYISELSVRQKNIRLALQNTNDIEKREALKSERNSIQHAISKRALKNKKR